MIKLIDCYHYDENFKFDDTKHEGFDFEGYKLSFEKMTLEKLVELLDDKILNLFV